MTEPTMPAAIALSPDHAPPPPVPSGPDLRAIDLAPAAGTGLELLDDGTRAHLARAGQEALDACLGRFAPEERAAVWGAISRCYNRPDNSPEASPAEVSAVDASPDIVPAAHVIDAVRPVPASACPEAVLR